MGRAGGDKCRGVEAVAAVVGWDPVGQNLYAFCPTSGGAAVYTER